MAVMALAGTLTVGYAFYSYQMKAAPATLTYYGVGDKFERTNTDTFTMGGVEWHFFYTDVSSDTGYIVSENLVISNNCPNTIDQIYVAPKDVENCLMLIQNSYSSSLDDDSMGKLMRNINQVTDLKLMTLQQYDFFTNNDTDSNMIDRLDKLIANDFWLDTFSDYNYSTQYDGRLFFWKDKQPSQVRHRYKNYKNVCDGSKALQTDPSLNEDAMSRIQPIFEVKLPQKGIIKNIMADKTSITKPYSDPINDAQSNIINVDTTEGEAPIISMFMIQTLVAMELIQLHLITLC